MLKISRRRFLQLVGAAMASGAHVPAFSAVREPYVAVGQVVDFIGHCPGGFVGGQLVHKVHPWDGSGYPVDLWNNAYGPARALERYYDYDLADMGREVPARFWWLEEHRSRYNNVHTYIRVKRFGETVEQAVESLNFAGTRGAS